MSRLLVTKLFWRAIKPAHIERYVSSNMLVCCSTAKNPLIRPTRFLASWGEEQVIDPKEIEFRVLKAISSHDKVDPSKVSVATHLINDLGLDSLDQVEIIIGIEDEFKLDIEDADSEKLLSVDDIVKYVVNHFEKTEPKAKNPGHEYQPGMMFGHESTK